MKLRAMLSLKMITMGCRTPMSRILLKMLPMLVKPSYPPGTLGNLLVKTSRVRQFLGAPPTKNGPGATKCGQNTPTGSYYSKSRHFCGAIAKKSAKNRAGGAKLPPRYFGKPACENQ